MPLPKTSSSSQTVCRICESSQHQEKWGLLRECENCRFIFFGDTDPEALARLYHEGYLHGEEYTDYIGQEFALRKSMRQHLKQMEQFKPLSGPLLEVGCAYGFFLDEAQRRIDHVQGIDVAREAVSYAHHSFGIKADYGDFLSFDFEGNRFSTICFWDTIEHLAEPDQFINRAWELLKPGGMIYLTTGDIGAFNARIRGKNWRQIHPPTHVSYFSRDTMRRILEQSGFEVMPIETASYFHTLKHVLGALAMRFGLVGTMAKLIERLVGDSAVGRWGFWLNLGDTMFVAARRPQK